MLLLACLLVVVGWYFVLRLGCLDGICGIEDDVGGVQVSGGSIHTLCESVCESYSLLPFTCPDASNLLLSSSLFVVSELSPIRLIITTIKMTTGFCDDLLFFRILVAVFHTVLYFYWLSVVITVVVSVPL